jgi:hypothetical protein
VLALLSAGCAIENETIKGEDTDTFFYGGRVSWEFADSPAAGESTRSSKSFLELDVSSSSSRFDQQVQVGHAVQIGNTQFVGPVEVEVDFDLTRVLGNLRHSVREASGLGLDLLLGLGYYDLDVTLSSPTQHGSDNFTGLGLLLGLALVYEPTHWLGAYVEGSLNPSQSRVYDSYIDINTLELGLNWRLQEHIALRTFWRKVVYKADDGQQSADLDLTASGPGVALSFSW